MMVKEHQGDDGTVQFVVVLSGMKLPEGTGKKIEHAIRRAVFAELANIDNGGDLVISPLGSFRGPGGGGQTEGIQAANADRKA